MLLILALLLVVLEVEVEVPLVKEKLVKIVSQRLASKERTKNL
jgi:hypothetical protein